MRKNVKSRKKSIIFRCVLAAILILIAICVIGIKIVNSSYVYDTIGTSNILKEGQKGTATINYNGADNKPESETITFKAGEPIELPNVTKEGYHFVEWSRSGFIVNSGEYIYSNNPEYKPLFVKDYSNINAPVAIYTDEFNFTEYNEGEYEKIDINNSEIFVDGGYKVYLYTKKNFKGKEKIVSYTSVVEGSYKSMKIEAFETETILSGELTDDKKEELLYKFAPRIWWAEGEEFFPTTIEDARANTDNILTDGGYSLILNELDCPTFKNEYLHGDLEKAKAYSFAIEKDEKYLDLSYFVFTPYNLGKTILGIEFANHIGDWEHISVRLMRVENGDEINWRPILMCCCAHSFENYYSWDDVKTTDNTHPIVYTAKGSHGMWVESGSNVYENFVVFKLTDECSQGTAWDLWLDGKIETYSYDSVNHTGYGIGDSKWENSFNIDYFNENSGSVAKWGNKSWNPPVCVYPQLSGGPSGPQNKPALNDYYTFN